MSSNGAWKKLGSRTVYHGYVSVNRDSYEEPNGNVTDWDVIDSGDTVATIAFTEEARYVVLFEQFRVGPKTVLRELPGGFVDRGELPMAAAARELHEETGYGSVTGFYAGSEWWAANSPRRKHLCIFADARYDAPPLRGRSEHGRVRLLPSSQLIQFLTGGELTDAGLACRGILRFLREQHHDSRLRHLRTSVAKMLVSGLNVRS